MSIERIAVVDGVRTPFAKQRTAYRDLSALDLGTYAVTELLERTEVDPAEIDQVVFGQVIPSVTAPNVAREIVLASGLPRSIEAYSVSRACATSYQATVNAAQAILARAADVVVAGGTDCVSDAPVTVSPALRDALADAAAAKSATDRVRAFAGLSPRDLLPEAPAIAEYSTGETMGEAAERMAKRNGIGRRAQDAFAHRSHTLAAKAWNEGHFAEEVVPVHVPPRYETTLEEDNVVRKDSEPEAYEKLRPVFDRAHGTVTAGNSSPLTDGAAALLVAREDKARALGLPILGFVRSAAFAALDPAGQLLMGPAYATPIALERAGIAFRDLDLIDMHEAFAAQMLSVLQAFGSKRFAERELGRAQPIGEVDDAKLNVNGGSIAIGHPFAATGARQITQTLRELRRRKGGFALCTACAAGGLGAAMVLEAA